MTAEEKKRKVVCLEHEANVAFFEDRHTDALAYYNRLLDMEKSITVYNKRAKCCK